ncbi:MAG TPA: FtsW/RodA/SpoVE family cell cycle protein [Candidatus Methylacidiphilales bacterium]|nr:FtsW/RodA/SpoVE family cell cycle protein [Candidatus Methylacidiphilales bacterium]
MSWSFPIILTLLALCVASIFAITSATYNNEQINGHPTTQLIYAIVGFVLYLVLAFLPYHWWVQISPTLYAVGVCLLVACYIPHLGSAGHGAKSWIRLGPVRFEPAEFVKFAYILAMAWYLRIRENSIQSFTTVLMAWIFTAIPFVLVLKQPALGTASVFFPICFAMLWAAGARPHHLIIPIALVAGVVVLSYYWIHVWNKPVPFLKDFQLKRVQIFFDPSLDPRGAGWQSNQAVIAIGSGGMDGQGWRGGVETELGYLPKGAVDNDMIFPVVGEDFGFRGAAALIIAEGIVLLWCWWVAASARDKIGALVAVGVMTMLFTHIFVNIGMTIQLVPITGIPLPFVSYGGTFLVVCLAAMGLVQSVWVHRLNFERR